VWPAGEASVPANAESSAGVVEVHADELWRKQPRVPAALAALKGGFPDVILPADAGRNAP